jgi:hypothetical protein
MNKYAYEGPITGLKLAHLSLNGLPRRVCVEGIEFDVRVLDGYRPRNRGFMARRVAQCVNDMVWDWHLGYMTGLRSQINESVKYTKRREAMLTSMGIVLK